MALALLELTETLTGELLERLVVTSVAEAAEQSLPGGAVSRIRLFTLIGDQVPGVAPEIRARLEHVAVSSLGQLGLQSCGEIRHLLMALWRDGHLKKLDGPSLAVSLADWLRQPSDFEGCVIIELCVMSRVELSPVEHSFKSLNVRLRNAVVSHMRRRSPAGGGHLVPDAAIGASQARLTTLAPDEQILFDAAFYREALAAEWLSASQVSARLGEQLDERVHCAGQLRRDGQLLGVYVTHPLPSYRYPTWQFRPDGRIVSHMAEILMLLHDSGIFLRESDGLRRTTGWGEVEWFMSPHALLGGATPAATLTVDSERVLRVAISEFDSVSE